MDFDSRGTGSSISPERGCSERPLGFSYSESSNSTSARRESSCAQASPRKGARSAGSRSRAAPTISLIFFHCCGASTSALLHGTRQPSFGHVPIPFHGGGRNRKRGRGLFDGQPAEKTQLDNAALLFIHFGEFVQDVIQGQHVYTLFLRGDHGFIHLQQAIHAALGRASRTRVIHQNFAHEPGGHGCK